MKSFDKHCNFSVGTLSAHTHPQYQAATALWFNHTMLKSSGVKATLPCTARYNRCAMIALAALDTFQTLFLTAATDSDVQTWPWPAFRRTSQVPHRVRRLVCHAQEPQKSAPRLYTSTHAVVCSLCFLTWQASWSSLICRTKSAFECCMLLCRACLRHKR